MRKIKKVMILIPVYFTLFSCRQAREINTNAGKNPVVISTNIENTGKELEILFFKGSEFNHPTFVFWIEDTSGKYLQTIYITKSYASGVYKYGTNDNGKWGPGNVKRPAALPYWSHKLYGNDVPTHENPLPDAVSAATPKGDFNLNSKLLKDIPAEYDLYLEINQTWDWNNYWTNEKFPDDQEYKTSCQPAVVYKARINMNEKKMTFKMNPVGHSHYSGKTGELFSDLSTLTTALKIVDKVEIKID